MTISSGTAACLSALMNFRVCLLISWANYFRADSISISTANVLTW